jgi:hypothetical protein
MVHARRREVSQLAELIVGGKAKFQAGVVSRSPTRGQ